MNVCEALLYMVIVMICTQGMEVVCYGKSVRYSFLPSVEYHLIVSRLVNFYKRLEALESRMKKSIAFESCKEILSKRSGKYLIKPNKNDEPFLGYCEQTAFGGGWLVFQYRYDGSVDFYRNWTEYRNGFGSMDGEFWLGLEQLHRLTSARKHELLVELKDFDGNYKYARYDEFAIGSEAEHYPLVKLGSYTGTSEDAFTFHKDDTFSTKDRDNDSWFGGNCATIWKGAWWYNKCGHSNLNGVYVNSYKKESMHWSLKHFTGMAYTRMMIRET
uniref:ryncolin-2-like n=1 Tax=Anopheles coluzzii TaxID=1518534 RepID=UPI0020FFA446|nr:ryncolin-2-like [Anopheles coluzzii]